MAAGDVKRLGKRDHRIVSEAVARAEATTGLEFCVYLGAVDDERPREHAEAMFVAAGLHERPAVVIVVAPKQRRIEIVTGPEVRGRISDEDAANAVAMMSASFARGELALGLVAAVEQLAGAAGPGTRVPGADLPNVLDG